MPEISVRVENVSKFYRKSEALRSVNLDVEPGDVVALLGPNGAGKTTLVSIITGAASPDSGSVKIFGFDPRRASARSLMGVMLQKSGLPDNLTVQELIELQMSYHASPLSLSRIAHLAGLERLLKMTPRRLSTGQARRVCYAIAICGRPDLLVLDEPSVGMDMESRNLLWQNIRTEAERGVATLLTTHLLEEADALANRVVLIDEGRVVTAARSSDLKSLVGHSVIICQTRLDESAVALTPGRKGIKLLEGKLKIFVKDPVLAIRYLLDADTSLADLQVRPSTLQDVLDVIETRRPVEDLVAN